MRTLVRYDRGVRTVLLALALVAVAGTHDASSRPARMDQVGAQAPISIKPVEPCGSDKVWKRIETCLAKAGAPRILYQAEGVKVVEVPYRTPSKSTRLSLYTLIERTWVRGNLYAVTSPNNELLGVAAFSSPLGVGVRIDMGQTVRTTIALNDGSPRGLVRLITSTICVPGTWQCRGVMTACDTYVRGRLVWTFHGAISWHPSLGVRLEGDTTRVGGSCVPPLALVDRKERN
jgi:hypothetical protein